MATQITKLTEKRYLVNGKAVYQSDNGKWIPEIKFEDTEIRTFKSHLKVHKKEIKIEFENI